MTAAEGDSGPIAVERWPTELPLLVFVAVAAAFFWLLVAISILGLVYALLIGVVLFFSHVIFIAHVRGSAVKLGPAQFPELDQRVRELAARAGIRRVPDAYLMQSGGALNAFATKFLRSRIIVLYSDLLDACGDNEGARDFVIGHELGHIKAGHLSFHWLLAPGLIMPFLGTAYSRAREYTCDRYGMALSGARDGALEGLAILAAGGSHGPRVNLREFALQRRDVDTGWMTLAQWLSGYPPLAARIGALEPSLVADLPVSFRGPLSALGILLSFFFVPALLAGLAIGTLVPGFKRALDETAALEAPDAGFAGDEAATPPFDPDAAAAQVRTDAAAISHFVLDFYERNGFLPSDLDVIARAWAAEYPEVEFPSDPFDGLGYGFETDDGAFVIWSSGRDLEAGTADDIRMEFAVDD